jgi:hypothetical protein
LCKCQRNFKNRSEIYSRLNIRTYNFKILTLYVQVISTGIRVGVSRLGNDDFAKENFLELMSRVLSEVAHVAEKFSVFFLHSCS